MRILIKIQLFLLCFRAFRFFRLFHLQCWYECASTKFFFIIPYHPIIHYFPCLYNLFSFHSKRQKKLGKTFIFIEMRFSSSPNNSLSRSYIVHSCLNWLGFVRCIAPTIVTQIWCKVNLNCGGSQTTTKIPPNNRMEFQLRNSTFQNTSRHVLFLRASAFFFVLKPLQTPHKDNPELIIKCLSNFFHGFNFCQAFTFHSSTIQTNKLHKNTDTVK